MSCTLREGSSEAAILSELQGQEAILSCNMAAFENACLEISFADGLISKSLFTRKGDRRQFIFFFRNVKQVRDVYTLASSS